ncbi:MAG: response regulator transcription factor [Planctomycetes bacterium]|nr:response regulator transcription factor [Planctomycetota bacterium]
MTGKILVIEDEPDLAMGLRDNLEFEGYTVFIAHNGEDGLDLAVKEQPHCVLLDIMLPGMDGFDTCHAIRKKNIRAPILMLTALSTEVDKVKGLDLGADDYITKPFNLKELMARIRAALRRFEPVLTGKKRRKFKVGRATVLLERSMIQIEDEDIPLGHYETQILEMLSQEPGSIIDRQQLLSEIWGLDNEPMNRSVDNHIVSLRRKIEEDPKSPRHIITVHGFGYKLVK